MTQTQKKILATSTLLISVLELFSAASFAEPSPEQKLLEAVDQSDIQRVRDLISAGANIHTTDPHGRMPIHLAARHGHHAVVALLLDNDALPCAANRFANTPLMYATHFGHIDVAKMLIAALDKTNNSRLINFPNAQGDTALHLAARSDQLEIVSLLLQHPSICPHQINLNGKTALHLAIELQRHAIVSLFLEKNIDLDDEGNEITGPNGESMFNHAAYASNPAILTLLVEKRGACAATQNNLGQTALHYAARCGNAQLLDILANHYNSTSQHDSVDTQTFWNATALHWASKFGHQDAVITLLKHGACTDFKDVNGRTALYVAARNKHQKTVGALLIFGVTIRKEDMRKLAEVFPQYETFVHLYRRKMMRALEELGLGLPHNILEVIVQDSVSSLQKEPPSEEKEPEPAPAPIELAQCNSLRSRTANRIRKFLTRTKHV